MITLDDVLELEHRGWQALCSSTGGRFYGDLMTDDAVMVLVDGQVLARDQVAASLDDAPPWDEYAIDEARLVQAHDEVVVLVYRGTARRGEVDFAAAMSSVYVRRDDRLRLALYQQS